MSEMFKFERTSVDQGGDVLGYFQATGMVPNFHGHLKRRGTNLDLGLFRPGHRPS